MSICASGASTTKPGVPPSVVVDQAYVQSLLPTGLAWLYPYLPWMHGLQIGDVSAFCAVDPPNFSVPTAAQIYTFITSSWLGDALVVNEFIVNVTKAYLWFSLCKCTSGVTPPPPAAPASPGNLPVVNPPGIVAPGPAVSCAERLNGGPRSVLGANSGNLYDEHSGVWVVPGTLNRAFLGSGLTGILLDHVNWHFVNNASGGVHETITVSVQSINRGTTNVLHTYPGSVAVPSGGSADFVTGWVAGDEEYLLNYTTPDALCTDTLGFSAEAFCPGTVGGVSNVCCSDVRVQQILDLVTLLQRQMAPFAYIPSTAHVGLTGDGNLEISGLVGISVTLTTQPAWLGQEGSSPGVLFDVGFVTFGTDDGYDSSFRITHGNQVYLPPRASAYTDLAYSLAPGVVATITELVREP